MMNASMRKILLVLTVSLITLGPRVWAAGAGFGQMWSQPPVEIDPNSPTPAYCGWDESSFTIVPLVTPRFQFRKIVADDFRCLGNVPITSVQWWGSYRKWDSFKPPKVKPVAWLIGFWTNIPALAQADPDFSHPGTLLWQVEVSGDRVLEKFAGSDSFPDKPAEACFEYSVELKPDEYFLQSEFLDVTEDETFWISINAVYADLVFPESIWGWKTRPQSWMDDAVTFDMEGALEPGYSPVPVTISPLSNSAVCGEPNGYDMTFVLGTGPDYIKWELPFTGIRQWPYYEDVESMATGADAGGGKRIQYPDFSSRGLDVDATADIPPTWPPVTLADDFLCTTPGPLTGISIWGSFFEDQLPGNGPGSIRFKLKIHRALHPGSASPLASTPMEVLWSREFRSGEYSYGVFAEDLKVGWYAPARDAPNYQPVAGSVCWKYDFSIDPKDAFIQEGTPQNPVAYWLSVQAFIVHPPGSTATRFGWKTSRDTWNDGAVWAEGEELPSNSWRRLTYPAGHPLQRDMMHLAFDVSTQNEKQKGPAVRRMVADDWASDGAKPVTSVVWWGSYIDYAYQACRCSSMPAPVRPDYFLLSMWTDVPAGGDNLFSRPGEKIWEYKADDYDEILVGYDRQTQDPNGGKDLLWEPVYRYSVRLSDDKRFSPAAADEIYWFSVMAVYTDPDAVNYSWGWTNHPHTFQADAAAGQVNAGGDLQWEALKDQTGKTEDMSFILFTEPK